MFGDVLVARQSTRSVGRPRLVVVVVRLISGHVVVTTNVGIARRQRTLEVHLPAPRPARSNHRPISTRC